MCVAAAVTFIIKSWRLCAGWNFYCIGLCIMWHGCPNWVDSLADYSPVHINSRVVCCWAVFVTYILFEPAADRQAGQQNRENSNKSSSSTTIIIQTENKREVSALLNFNLSNQHSAMLVIIYIFRFVYSFFGGRGLLMLAGTRCQRSSKDDIWGASPISNILLNIKEEEGKTGQKMPPHKNDANSYFHRPF